jgi:hypothetical protein
LAVGFGVALGVGFGVGFGVGVGVGVERVAAFVGRGVRLAVGTGVVAGADVGPAELDRAPLAVASATASVGRALGLEDAPARATDRNDWPGWPPFIPGQTTTPRTATAASPARTNPASRAGRRRGSGGTVTARPAGDIAAAAATGTAGPAVRPVFSGGTTPGVPIR